jgi:chorismate mutase
MHCHLEKLALVAAVAIGWMGAAYAQNAVEQLQPLVETSAQRLMIGEQVALAKWDSGKAVEDAPREAQVILGAMKDGVAKGLDEASVSNFFNAQLEANKLVQYALLADWYRAGKAPEHAPVDLLKVIRPQLDEVQKSLIADWWIQQRFVGARRATRMLLRRLGSMYPRMRMVVARLMRRRLIDPWLARAHCESRDPEIAEVWAI